MNKLLSQYWSTLALRGVVSVLFGVFALIWPQLTLLALVGLFAAYALLGGAISIAGAIRNRKNDDEWGLLLLLGLVGLAAGAIAIVYPGLTALALVMVVGANALISGVLEIAVAIRLRKEIGDEWLLILSGAISMLFGTFVFLFPGPGALAMVWMISFYALATGVLLLTVAFRLRGKTRAKLPDRRFSPDRRSTSAMGGT